MSDVAINFFNPADVLSLNASNWIQQENNIVDTNQRAQGLSAVGDEAVSQLHGGGSAGTVVYECHKASGNLTLPVIGLVAGGYHLDSFSLAYNPVGWPRLTCNVHQHDDNPHATGLNTFTPSLTCPAGFGVPRALGIASLGAVNGVRSCTYTVGCTHVDEDENGDHLAGENRDGVETLAYEFTGSDLGVGFTPPAGWDELSDGTPKSNTGAETTAMSWEHHIARDA